MTEIELPEPLVPADVDLRDFPHMQLDVARLRDSSLSTRATGDEFRAAVLLWCAAWHQVPAGSLPDDDVDLAGYAGYGRVVMEWRKVRDGALRGFIKCSDGRLYHPVVCEKARSAWADKVKFRGDREADRRRKKEKHGGEAATCPPDNGDLSAGQTENSAGQTENSAGQTENSAGQTENSAGQETQINAASDGFPPENALRGRGRGKGKGKEPPNPPGGAADVGNQGNGRPGGADWVRIGTAFLVELGADPADCLNFSTVGGWLNAGCTEPEIIAAGMTLAPQYGRKLGQGDAPKQPLAYFRAAVPEAIQHARSEHAAATSPLISEARQAEIRAEVMAEMEARRAAKAATSGHAAAP